MADLSNASKESNTSETKTLQREGIKSTTYGGGLYPISNCLTQGNQQTGENYVDK